MIKTTLYLSFLTAILLGIGFFVAGTSGMVIGLLLAGTMNVISYYYSDKIVMRLYNGKEIDKEEAPDLHRTVDELASEMNIPKPKIYLVNMPTPNAFATGRNPKNASIAVTKSLLSDLNKREVKAVLAHELTHVKNRDTLLSSIAATIAGAIAIISRMLFFGFIGGDGDEGGSLAFLIVMPFVATLIRLAISRSREYKADKGAAINTSKESMISSLKKIHNSKKLKAGSVSQMTSHMFIENPFSSSKITELFMTHPTLENRIENIKNTDT